MDNSKWIFWLITGIVGLLLTVNASLVVFAFNTVRGDIQLVRAEVGKVEDKVDAVILLRPELTTLKAEVDRLREELNNHKSTSAHRDHPHPTDSEFELRRWLDEVLR